MKRIALSLLAFAAALSLSAQGMKLPEGFIPAKLDKTYVEAHIQEEISIDEMVQELGVSKSNFYRKLKNITDWSPVDIINLIRLRRTVNLVIHQGMNLSQASTESGFNSLSYFSRTFVKYYHISARDWIKQQLGK